MKFQFSLFNSVPECWIQIRNMEKLEQMILHRIEHFLRLLDDLSYPTWTFTAFQQVSLAA